MRPLFLAMITVGCLSSSVQAQSTPPEVDHAEVMRLGDTYPPERMEAACNRALHFGGLSSRSVRSILKHGLDQVPLEEQTHLALPQDHDHVRGERYYATTSHGDPE